MEQFIGASRYVAAAVAVLPLTGVGLALGILFAVSINTVGRNPGARNVVFPITILGFALTEAIGLFTLLVVFLILFS